MLLKNAKIFFNKNFIRGNLLVENSKIAKIDFNCEYDNLQGTDCNGNYIFPTLVDIHTHGCFGYDFSFANADEIADMRSYYLKNGIGTILPTTVSLNDKDIEHAVKTIQDSADEAFGLSDVLGINIEGPYLSPVKCGAHDTSLLKEPDFEFIESLGDFIQIVNIAPEYNNATDFIKKFKGKTSIAHTACDYNTAMKAIESGANHITHIFNAMDGMNHRNPGVIGAFFDSDAYAEIICDSVHIHNAVLRMMFNTKPDRLIIISDSMSATGLVNGKYKLGNLDVTVQDRKAFLTDGTLAGSVMNIYDMMKNLISIGVDKENAVASATIIPAESVGIDNICGKIDTGRNADFIIADDKFDIRSIIHKGKVLTSNSI